MPWSTFLYLLIAALVIFGIFKLIIAKFFQTYYARECGHTTKRKGEMEAFGGKCLIKMPVNEDGTVDYCLKCLEEMSIQCAWCGNPIFIGNPVTLYPPIDPNYQPPAENYATYSEDPWILVGCLRWDCASTEPDRAGFWHPPGKVFRVLSPTEQLLQANDMVVGNDLTDPSKE